MTCLGDRQRVCTSLYDTRGWGPGESRSGHGSSLQATSTIRERIPLLMKKWDLTTILDLPCGDYHWMAHVRCPDGVQYIGADIVESVVAENRRRHPKVDFRILDLCEGDLPTNDVILCRDALVHFPITMAMQALRNCVRSGSRYLLTTTFPKHTVNRVDVGWPSWQPLNLQLAPYNFPEPLELLNENLATDPAHADKSLGLWELSSIAAALQIVGPQLSVIRTARSSSSSQTQELLSCEVRIPLSIYQTMETVSIVDSSPGMRQARDSWISMNPHHVHSFATAEQRKQFMERHFEKRVVDAYARLTNGAAQADMWRYCILYVHGGVYSDIDQVCLVPVSTFVAVTDSLVVAAFSHLSGRVMNGFIAATVRHPVLLDAINAVVANVEARRYIDDIGTLCGPVVFTAALRQHYPRAFLADGSAVTVGVHPPGEKSAAQGTVRILTSRYGPSLRDWAITCPTTSKDLIVLKYDSYLEECASANIQPYTSQKTLFK